MILGDIVHAIVEECKYLFLDMNATVILDTQLDSEKVYDMPLCIIEIGDDSESGRLPGNGITRFDLNFSLSVYNYEPNAYNDSDNGYATSLLDITDTVRNYFENEKWTTQEMVNLTSSYGFRLTFQGSNKAQDLVNDDNIVMGRTINFNSIAFDQNTNSSNDIVLASGGTATGTVVFQ